MCLLLLLVKLRVVRRRDFCALVLSVFGACISLVRRVQRRYGLQPAGTKALDSMALLLSGDGKSSNCPS